MQVYQKRMKLQKKIIKVKKKILRSLYCTQKKAIQYIYDIATLAMTLDVLQLGQMIKAIVVSYFHSKQFHGFSQTLEPLCESTCERKRLPDRCQMEESIVMLRTPRLLIIEFNKIPFVSHDARVNQTISDCGIWLKIFGW